LASAHISRRQLLQALGTAAIGLPFTDAAFGQGRCRDGYGTANCPLTSELATKPIAAVFASTGWQTVALDHITFRVADYKAEAAFYIALMGWTLRDDDGARAVLDIGSWGSCIFKQGEAATFETITSANARRSGRGGPAVTAIVDSFCFVIEPWNARTVEAELRKRGLDPVADNGRNGFESFHISDPDGWDLQISNGNGLVNVRQIPSSAKLSHALPFEPTGWKTVWLDHFSFGAADYKKSVSFYTNLLGWTETYDEGSQNELLMGDVGDIIIRGGNSNDPKFGRHPNARERRIDHISFGISPWDTDGVRAELEKRGLVASVDTSSAHPGPDGKMVPDDIHTAPFKSYHTRTPNGYDLQISWMNRERRLNLANAVKPKTRGK
jgi:catechol 2,3-dioxygenase-like lactoylglutathione lyase family enzyme